MREQTFLRERKEGYLGSGAHRDPQSERHMSGSLPRTSPRENNHSIHISKQRRATFFTRNGS